MIGVGPVVYGMAPLSDCRETDAGSSADVVADADDQINLVQSPLIGRCRKLSEPFAVHVQADCRRRVEKLDKRGKLKKIVHIYDIAFRQPDADCHPKGIE
jgi:hypothetical protein